MRRELTAALVALAFVGLLVALPTAAVAQDATNTTTTDAQTTNETTTATPVPTEVDENETEADDNETDLDENETEEVENETDLDENESEAGNESLPPGARLGAMVGIQQTELQSEVDGRAFGLSIAAARSDNARVKVLAKQHDRLRDEVANLTEHKQELREAHRNGSLSTAQFHAEMAELHAEQQAATRMANHTENASAGLPEETLRANGVNVSAMHRLRQNASQLTGPEVARIARSIGGHGPPAMGGGPPAGVPGRNGSMGQGPPDGVSAGNGGGPQMGGNQSGPQMGGNGGGPQMGGNQSGPQTGGTGGGPQMGGNGSGSQPGGNGSGNGQGNSGSAP